MKVRAPRKRQAERQPELPWPGERAPCPKCAGTGNVHRTMQHGIAHHAVIGGKRVACSACGGTGKVRVPLQGSGPAIGPDVH